MALNLSGRKTDYTLVTQKEIAQYVASQLAS